MWSQISYSLVKSTPQKKRIIPSLDQWLNLGKSPEALWKQFLGELINLAEIAFGAHEVAKSSLQENPQEKDVVKDALAFGKKIWDSAKLESVLSRCLDDPGPAPSLNTSIKSRNIHNLSKLLQSERIYGLSERDPTQKRHDFRYFTRGSHFVLIEDIRGELATIAAHEYPVYKEREGRKTPWPTLHCHPQARGPFILFDEKEKKRWDRLQEAEKKETAERRARCEMFLQRQTTEKKTEPGLLARRAGDLRRSVSLNNMPNAAREELLVDHDADGDVEFISASGFLASGLIGYMAASGNSVSITSTIGTTSTANYAFRTQQMPSNLNGKIRQEIIMHRQPQDRLTMANKMANKMGPPVGVPQRHAVLKKSKSTTTIKLPKREEGSKPGYCESCRSKFNDFREVWVSSHILATALTLLTACSGLQTSQICWRRSELRTARWVTDPCPTTEFGRASSSWCKANLPFTWVWTWVWCQFNFELGAPFLFFHHVHLVVYHTNYIVVRPEAVCGMVMKCDLILGLQM